MSSHAVLDLMASSVADLVQTLPMPDPKIPDPAPQAPPGIGPKISTLLSWAKWGVLIAGAFGLFLCAGKMGIGQGGRSAYAAEGASEIPKVLLALSLAAVTVPIVTTLFGA